MSNKNRVQLHEDKMFFYEAGRFRKHADNAPNLRERLVALGHEDQALLLDQIKWLKRPTEPQMAVDQPGGGIHNIFGAKQPNRRPFHFGKILDEPVDAVEWLEALGALRLDKHFQCHWAACAVVMATEGWATDRLTKRGRRWTPQMPDLPRAAFLLHWKDYRDAYDDWNRHLERLRQLEAARQVSEFTRTKLREDGFFRRIMPLVQPVGQQPVLHTSPDTPGHGWLNISAEDKIECIRVLPKVSIKEAIDGQQRPDEVDR